MIWGMKFTQDIRLNLIKGEVFFLGGGDHGEFILVQGQTNPVNCKAVLRQFICAALRFIPNEPRKKTLIPYIYSASNNDSF